MGTCFETWSPICWLDLFKSALCNSHWILTLSINSQPYRFKESLPISGSPLTRRAWDLYERKLPLSCSRVLSNRLVDCMHMYCDWVCCLNQPPEQKKKVSPNILPTSEVEPSNSPLFKDESKLVLILFVNLYSSSWKTSSTINALLQLIFYNSVHTCGISCAKRTISSGLTSKGS